MAPGDPKQEPAVDGDSVTADPESAGLEAEEPEAEEAEAEEAEAEESEPGAEGPGAEGPEGPEAEGDAPDHDAPAGEDDEAPAGEDAVPAAAGPVAGTDEPDDSSDDPDVEAAAVGGDDPDAVVQEPPASAATVPGAPPAPDAGAAPPESQSPVEERDWSDDAAPAAGGGGDTLPHDTQWVRAKRRQRRQTWTFLAMFLLVLATGAASYGYWTGVWTLPGGAARAATICPAPSITAAPKDAVQVNVLNATERRGLAQTVARQLQARGFRVIRIDNDTGQKPVKQAVVVRYGPSGQQMARTLAAQINGTVRFLQDTREDTTVDLSLQARYKALRPAAAANKLTAPVPVASPRGCVPASPTP